MKLNRTEITVRVVQPPPQIQVTYKAGDKWYTDKYELAEAVEVHTKLGPAIEDVKRILTERAEREKKK